MFTANKPATKNNLTAEKQQSRAEAEAEEHQELQQLQSKASMFTAQAHSPAHTAPKHDPRPKRQDLAVVLLTMPEHHRCSLRDRAAQVLLLVLSTSGVSLTLPNALANDASANPAEHKREPSIFADQHGGLVMQDTHVQVSLAELLQELHGLKTTVSALQSQNADLLTNDDVLQAQLSSLMEQHHQQQQQQGTSLVTFPRTKAISQSGTYSVTISVANSSMLPLPTSAFVFIEVGGAGGGGAASANPSTCAIAHNGRSGTSTTITHVDGGTTTTWLLATGGGGGKYAANTVFPGTAHGHGEVGPICFIGRGGVGGHAGVYSIRPSTDGGNGGYASGDFEISAGEPTLLQVVVGSGGTGGASSCNGNGVSGADGFAIFRYPANVEMTFEVVPGA
ncbi:hypothetical protein PTSG_08778 [Salpingoeca rosetta]|uniref:Uncharacterized protein n=1 Tax=Salpingoeca rosetta (strain ATCC 50818 / BSB-021) TaxID=946362 RepID=F2UKN6_SALR5|nr:uncharacterized protein PTSG_08778 [Salpingoeca rosetta]EGD77685.1 hypothetical protein PTSG_08778 [Salpingoeca rosetta]|eukprot:XP_004990161.1 hypothetical protein PTSG_08778 [Salpingoeca rosetta]